MVSWPTVLMSLISFSWFQAQFWNGISGGNFRWLSLVNVYESHRCSSQTAHSKFSKSSRCTIVLLGQLSSINSNPIRLRRNCCSWTDRLNPCRCLSVLVLCPAEKRLTDVFLIGGFNQALMSELEKREIQVSAVQDRGEALMLQHHPASKCVEAYMTALQTQWHWLLQLTLCLETHLRHASVYHNFFTEVQKCEQWCIM